MISINQRERWILVIGYILFIYATLGAVVAPLHFLREHGVLRLTLMVFYVLCSLGLLQMLIKTGTREPWRFLTLAGVLLSYILISKMVKIPEEQLHFLEYGLVGVLFARALNPMMGFTWKTFLVALILAGLAGWLDEVIQGHIPTRHYDVHDIFLNILSAFMGLFLYSTFPSENRIRNSSIQQKSALRS